MAESERGYDGGTPVPDWWLQLLEKHQDTVGTKDAALVAAARQIDGRSPSWGPDRLVKLRKEERGSIPLVEAVSAAASIPSPVVRPRDLDEATALAAWLTDYRRRRQIQSGTFPKIAAISQALDASVKDKIDQTKRLPSGDEGSPRSPRTRRAPRSR